MLAPTTTTGTILRPPEGDPYETAAAPTEVATGIASHISTPTGSETDLGGQLARIDAVLLAEPGIDLLHTDLWRDDGTGVVYRVGAVRRRQGLGLDHTVAGLAVFEGGAVGG